MRIFVYEFVTGGGTFSDESFGPPAGSLLAQGKAMAAALAADFDQIDDVEVVMLRDVRVATSLYPTGEERLVHSADEELAAFREFAASAAFTVVIAPEMNGHLLDRCQTVESCGGRLLGPSSDFVALTSDKYLCNRYLQQRNVPVPPCRLADAGASPPAGWPLPFVRKPRWGAGSEGICLIHGAVTIEKRGREPFVQRTRRAVPAKGSRPLFSTPLIVEQFIAGTAASVAVVYGPNQTVILPACSQTLTTDGQFRYLGGGFPLDRQLATRAAKLARTAVDALPKTIGYIGLDLVLGANADGSSDAVIEVNPRLTTSYTGLRAACKTNLAAAMLQLSKRKRIELSFHDSAIEFTCDGVIR